MKDAVKGLGIAAVFTLVALSVAFTTNGMFWAHRACGQIRNGRAAYYEYLSVQKQHTRDIRFCGCNVTDGQVSYFVAKW